MRMFMTLAITWVCVATALGQAPQAPRQKPQGVTGAHTTTPATPQQNTEAQINDLNEQIQQLRNEISELKGRSSAQARPPVALTPDEQFPAADEKADNLQTLQTAVRNLWAAIGYIRQDLKKLNGQK